MKQKYVKFLVRVRSRTVSNRYYILIVQQLKHMYIRLSETRTHRRHQYKQMCVCVSVSLSVLCVHRIDRHQHHTDALNDRRPNGRSVKRSDAC